MYQNFRSKFPGVLLRKYFWSTVVVSTTFLFEKAMSNIKSINKDAYDWLNNVKAEMWFRHAFEFLCKSDHVTDNVVECFNQWIAPFRSKPVLLVVDEIRKLLMEIIYKRYQEGCTYTGIVTPRIKKLLDLIQTQSRGCMVQAAGVYEFEVTDTEGRHVVDLKKQTCCCKEWEGSGLPCKHAAACIVSKRENLENYCHEYYSIRTYLAAYEGIIHPLPGLQEISEEHRIGIIQPPPIKRLSGRPHSLRKKETDEVSPGKKKKDQELPIVADATKKVTTREDVQDLQ
ncbi:uncharacterized protein LOC122059218 [Macadamia integrifolia]|uniref:uncharacterized protein LOC122059218 n=1 Tax=Macadamia integrifolia TaxID=60698 RepID=UPI001C52B15E|nr:uncharacterized protein LOC122059218 [Macadamia integrifolia]